MKIKRFAISLLLLSTTIACLAQTTAAEENTWRRATQMLNVSWRPQDTIPSTGSVVYRPSKTYTGVPYCQTKEIDKFIGFDVSFTTFLTAVNNPYSLLYTEDINGDRSTSYYGFLYHGTTAGPYMGVDCSCFVGYSIGLPFPWKTAQYAYLAETAKIMTKVVSYSEDDAAQKVKPYDIMWKSGHVRLITGVTYDSDGNVTNVKVSEATSAYSISNTRTALTRNFTASAFNEQLTTDKGIIYRYNNLENNTSYTKSPVVAAEGESAVSYTYNNDICTFRGDSCSFREGEMIVLNYNLKSVGSWTTLQLYKDDGSDELIQEYTIDTDAHRCDITPLNLTYGKYKACMSDGATQSAFTYFEVINTEVSSSLSSTTQTIKFSSANATPIYMQYCSETGANRGSYPFTDSEISAKSASVDYADLMNEQYSTVYSTSTTYVKVHFQGEYGRVTSKPFLLTEAGPATKALYGRPAGAFFAGVNESGGRIGSNAYLTIPNVQVTFPNWSSDCATSYWTYKDVDGEGTTTQSETLEDLTLDFTASESGKNYTAPTVYADDSTFTMATYVHVDDGNYVNSKGVSYLLANHSPWGTSGAKSRHYREIYYKFNNATVNSNWLDASDGYNYDTLQIKSFVELFRQPLKPYKLAAAHVQIYKTSSMTLADTGLKLEICKATVNEYGILQSIGSKIATWTATEDNLTQVSGNYYLMKFSGDSLLINSPIVLKLSVADESDTSTDIVVCNSQNPQDFGERDQSAFIEFYSSVTSSSGTVTKGTYLKSAYKKLDSDYMRSFCFYLDVKYCETVSVTIGETGYGTLYYSDKNLVVPAGVTATTYVVENGSLTATKVYKEGDVIPANMAVVIYDGKGSVNIYQFMVTTEEGEAPSANDLYGTDEDQLITSPTDSKYYKLSLNADEEAGSIGFYYGADDGAAFTNEAHKAYLAVSPTSTAKTSYPLNGDPTGIEEITLTNPVADGKIYDLQGRRVTKPTKGVYICNGKKIIIR